VLPRGETLRCIKRLQAYSYAALTGNFFVRNRENSGANREYEKRPGQLRPADTRTPVGMTTINSTMFSDRVLLNRERAPGRSGA
jgi:hypothetical protein